MPFKAIVPYTEVDISLKTTLGTSKGIGTEEAPL